MSTNFPRKLRQNFERAFEGNWLRNVIYQRLLVIVLILLQIAFFIMFSVWVSTASTLLNVLMQVISWTVVFLILVGNKLGEYKLSWIILVLAFPLVGGVLYVLLSTNIFSRKLHKRLEESLFVIRPLRRSRSPIYKALAKVHNGQNTLATYINETSGYPLYLDGDAHYLADGQVMLDHMLEAMEGAKDYIFLEFFIVSNDSMLDQILEVLTRKVAEGVEVLFLYDDMGSMFRLPQNFPELLEEMGIRCRRFNHLVPVVSTQFNNRDHRKIVVVDGRVAYTGGINLADEYINVKPRFGHWKDSGLVYYGEAAWATALMFLELWIATGGEGRPEREAIVRYCPDPAFLEMKEEVSEEALNTTGFIQPYGDSPFDNVYIGRMVYNKLIYYADHYLYITTPYLILDEEMVQSICQAAQSGVDVRIITPHIWDKAYVRIVSRSYYEQFIRAGVRIFEYTPGFIHSKTLVTDDETAVVGTINFDYRSLYLHFEDAVVVYNQKCVQEVKADFLATQAESQAIALEDCKLSLPKRLFALILRLFSPLM